MATQVKFIGLDDTEPRGGILLDNGCIICGCCGGLFEPEDYIIIEKYDYWVPLTNEIIGDDT